MSSNLNSTTKSFMGLPRLGWSALSYSIAASVGLFAYGCKNNPQEQVEESRQDIQESYQESRDETAAVQENLQESEAEAQQEIAGARQEAQEEAANAREGLAEEREEATEEIANIREERNQEVADAQREIAETQGEATTDSSTDSMTTETTGKTADNADPAAGADKKAMHSQLKDQFDTLSTQVEELEDSINEKDDAVKNEMAVALADLKAKEAAADVKVKALEKVSEGQWTSMRDDVKSSLAELESAIVSTKNKMSAH